MTVREKVLEMLRAGETVSGERMAGELGVSRNAVWKAVNALRKEGYRIEGGTRRGYRMEEAPDLLSEREIRRWLRDGEIGREIELHDQLDSTNNRAKALAAAGAPHGLLVTADSQTGGRGRRGRSFFSPPHSGIYLSYILRPACTPEQASMMTSLTAVAVARAIETVAPAQVRIKWVNDLFLGEKKICGILSEAGMNMETGELDYIVVGIGVNVGRMRFPPELEEIAGSIENETGAAVSRNRLIAEISNELNALYGDLRTGAFLEESRRRSNVIGREIRVIEGDRSYEAEALDLDGQGRLIIRRGDETVRLDYGEVSLRLKPETDFVRERVSEAATKSSSGQNGRRELTFKEETDFVRERVSEAATKSSSGQNGRRELTFKEEKSE